MSDKEQLQKLANSYRELDEAKLAHRLKMLEQMRSFYSAKAAQAEEYQMNMFINFVRAISYAISVIEMHRALTNKLARLAERGSDDSKTV